MDVRVYDNASIGVRLAGAVLLGACGGATYSYWHPGAVLLWIAAILVLAVQDYLLIDLKSGAWRTRRGVWPLVASHAGTRDQLYGIEITVRTVKADNSGYGNNYSDHSGYTTYLHWQPGLLGPRELLYANGFSQVATPAMRLSLAVGIPVLLGQGMTSYSTQLDEIRQRISLEEQ